MKRVVWCQAPSKSFKTLAIISGAEQENLSNATFRKEIEGKRQQEVVGKEREKRNERKNIQLPFPLRFPGQ